jgi:hypothetical protein
MRSELEAILARLDEIRALADDDTRLQARRPGLSAWSVAQQLHHSAIVAATIATAVRALLRGAGTEDEPTSEAARAILEAGQIPRGVADAPEGMVPDPEPAQAEILALVDKARSRWRALRDEAEELAACPRKAPHPLLGPLSATEWARFAAVHTGHHLAIVADIIEG